MHVNHYGAWKCPRAGMEAHSRLPHRGSASFSLAVQLIWVGSGSCKTEIPNNIVQILF